VSDSIWKKEISFGRKKPAQDAAADAPAAPVEPAPESPTPSVWKKEISFGRKKPAQDAATDAPAAPIESAPESPTPSVWKKEISFGRKKPVQDAAADAPAAPVEPAPAQPKQSAWKKELSFGRKAKEVAPEQVEASSAPEPEQSVWKKEISFSRKKRDKELERIAEDAAQVVAPSFAPVPPPSDLAPTALAEAAVAAMPEVDVDEPPAPPEAAEPAPLVALPSVELPPPTDEPLSPVPAPLQIAPEPWEPAPEPAEAAPLQIAPEPWEPAPEPAEPAPLQIAPEPWEPAPEPAEPAPLQIAPEPSEPAPELAEPAPVEAVMQSREPAEAPLEAAEPLPLSTPFAPVSFEQAPGVPMVPSEPAPVASAPVTPVPELPLDAVATAEPEQPLVQPLAPPLSTLSAAVLAASTDVPAVAVPPEADVVGFPEAPTAPVEPAQPESVALTPVPPPIQLTPEPVEPPPLTAAEQPVDPWLAAAELPPAPASPLPTVVHPPVPSAELPLIAEPKVPFWKKQVSFSRKPKENLEPVLAGPVTAGGPWWKKELSFSRTPKPAAAVETAAQSAVAPAAKTPWWKKELGGKKGGAVATAAADAPTDVPAGPKTPFWKRQLSVSTPKLPKGSAKAGKKGPKGAKRLVGLKIGASQLAAARVSNNGVAELEQVARQPLPMGIVVGGELRDPDALTEALKVFFAKNKLPKKGVRLGIANNRIGVRIFDIVGVDEAKQLDNAIHFRAQETLPIPLDEAVLDYHVLDESVDAEGRNVKRVLLVVAYKELIDRYVGACRKAGITLAGIDLEAFALLRSLSPPTDGGSAALVAVAIGYDRSTFAVSDGRVCEFTRVLEWGGWTLNVALARAFDTAPSEVEALKCALSLDGSIAPDDLSPEQTAAAVETVRRQVQSFARELVSSLQFYQNQPGSLGIGEIVITGGTAQLPGLAEELERLIGVKVRVGNPLARLKVSKRVGASASQIGSLAVAIGLGIED
jgi:type IV pilus assembly protein PilM